MEEASKIDWEPILWGAGGLITFFCTVITGLVTWLVMMYKDDKTTSQRDRAEFREILARHDERILNCNEEIKELAVEIKEIGTQAKASIEMGNERLKIFQDNFFTWKKKK